MPFLLALLLFASPVIGQTVSNRVLQAVRPITLDGQNICTATKIDETRDLWLTAAHCIPPAQTLLISDPNSGGLLLVGQGQADIRIGGIPAIVVESTEENDMAVLFVPGVSGKALKLQKHAPAMGQKIRMIGHPNGYDTPQLFQGYISSLDLALSDEHGGVQHFTMFDMTSCGGNSGSAVLNSREEIVSVLQIGHGRPCDGFTGGARWTDLVRFAAKYFR